jgi:hypothetical protein
MWWNFAHGRIEADVDAPPACVDGSLAISLRAKPFVVRRLCSPSTRES